MDLLSDDQALWLLDRRAEAREINRWVRFTFDEREAWNEHRSTLLAAWVRDHVGSRPDAWWRFDSPEPRQRLGGKGTAAHDGLNHAPSYWHGIPDRWVDTWLIGYYTERNGIPYRYAEPFDCDDPPTFESEAAFLQRHELFMPGEKQRLSNDAFAPEVLPKRFWPKLTPFDVEGYRRVNRANG